MKRIVHKKKKRIQIKNVLFIGIFSIALLIFSFISINNRKQVLGTQTVDNFSTYLINNRIVVIPSSLRRPNGVKGSGIKRFGAIVSKTVIAPKVPKISFLDRLVQIPLAFFPKANASQVDLSIYNPPVGDQEDWGTCMTWAVGYYLRGWYANKDHYYPSGGFAPMFLYAQVYPKYVSQKTCSGNDPKNCGSTMEDDILTLGSKGIDTNNDYAQGNYNIEYPTEEEMTNAYQYAYTNTPTESSVNGEFLFSSQNAQSKSSINYRDVKKEAGIKSAFDQGKPVVLTVPVFNNFANRTYNNFFVDLPNDVDYSKGSLGLHGIFAFGYNDQGVWIENSWGTGWGHNGGALLSWNFINQYAVDAAVLSTSLRRPFVKTCNTPNTCASSIAACGNGEYLPSLKCNLSNTQVCCGPKHASIPSCSGSCMTNYHACVASGHKIKSGVFCPQNEYCCIK